MKKLLSVMTVLLAMTAPTVAQAWDQAPEGAYLGVFGGASIPQTRKHRNHGSTNSGCDVRSFRLDTGYVVTGSIGYRFCEGFRAELEGGYHYNRHRKHHNNNSGNNTHRSRGNASTGSILVNGLYDFDTCWCVKPFAGVGIGWASTRVKRNNHCGNNNDSSSSGHRGRRDKDGFAWQVIAGLAYPFCDCWDVTVEYRYFNNTGVSRLHNHDIGLGLKYFF